MSTNVRVEAKFYGGNSRYDRERATSNLLRQFKRAVAESGVLHEMREREFYEKPGDKKRRKIRQADLQRRYAESAAKEEQQRRPANKDRRNNNE